MDEQVRQFFFGCDGSPANAGDETGRHYQAASRRKLIDDIVADVDGGRPVTTVEGETGIGKTIMASEVARRLQNGHRPVIQLDGRSSGPLHVQRLIAQAVGTGQAGLLDPNQLLTMINTGAAGKDFVLLVDDAERLSGATCSYLSLMIDLFKFSDSRFSIVFFGALGQRWIGLDHPTLDGLREQTAVMRIIPPLSDAEAVAYVDHRLQRAGGSLPLLMTQDAIAELVDYADGIPADLDAATDRVLLYAWRKRRKRIGAAIVRVALQVEDGGSVVFRLRGVPGRAAAAVIAVVVVACGGALVLQAPGWHRSAGQALAGQRSLPPVEGPALALAAVPRTPNVAVAPAAEPAATEQLAPAAPPHPIGRVAAPTRLVARDAPMLALSASAVPVTPATGPTLLSAPVVPPAAIPVPAPMSAPAPIPAPAPTPAPATSPLQAPQVFPGARLAMAGPPSVAGPPAADPAVTPMPVGAVAPTEEMTISQANPAAAREPVLAALASSSMPSNQGARLPPVRGAPGLVIVARAGDTLRSLYARLYSGFTPPAYEFFAAANQGTLRPGGLVIVPEPLDGWTAPRESKARDTSD